MSTHNMTLMPWLMRMGFHKYRYVINLKLDGVMQLNALMFYMIPIHKSLDQLYTENFSNKSEEGEGVGKQQPTFSPLSVSTV